MLAIAVDFSMHEGTIKPLHGVNNGPVGYGSLVDVSHYYRELAVPYARLHDPNWPHPREVDIPQVFPNFDADPDDPASYRFGPTDDYIRRILDTGARIVYRLGVSIEHTKTKYYTDPPADFEKWASICIGVIRHYTQRWADGISDGVDYWEIWNEPDTSEHMWSGTFEQYLDLYRVTASAIKALSPDLKVGGFASAFPHMPESRVPQFLGYCREHGLPLDFFSWHNYASSPEELARNARIARDSLNEYGFSSTESHLNEWNYMPPDFGAVFAPGYEYIRREAFERQKSEEGASFVAASLITLQDQPLDVANYYDGQPSALYCGIFDYYGVPQKTFHAFKAFSQMLDYPMRVKSTVSDEAGSLYALAATNPGDLTSAILVSNFGAPGGSYSIDMSNLPKERSVCRVYMVDRDHNLELLKTETIATGSAAIEVLLRKHAVALITIG